MNETNTLDLLKRNATRVLAIGAVLAVAAALFAYAGGFLSPQRLSGDRFIAQMERSGGGPHPGFRRAHSKGICMSGSFAGTAEGHESMV